MVWSFSPPSKHWLRFLGRTGKSKEGTQRYIMGSHQQKNEKIWENLPKCGWVGSATKFYKSLFLWHFLLLVLPKISGKFMVKVPNFPVFFWASLRDLRWPKKVIT